MVNEISQEKVNILYDFIFIWKLKSQIYRYRDQNGDY